MKILIIFGLINLLALLGSLAVGMHASVMAGRYFARDTIFIAPFLNESHLHWSDSNIAELQQQFVDYSISPVSRGNIVVQTTQAITTTVVYTDAAFFSISFMNFIEGNRWADYDSGIVLNEALAWRLFGGGDVLGLPVEINQKQYTVAGVVRQEQGGGEYMAWMPRSAMPVPLAAATLYIQAHNYNLVDVFAHTIGHSGMLNLQFRNPGNYAIVDINRYVETIGLRNRLFLYVLCVYALIVLIGVCVKQIPNRNRKNIVLCFVLPVLGVLAYILFTGVDDILYWLPNLAVSDTSVFEYITNIGALPPDGYLCFGLSQLAALNRMTNLAWIVGMVAFVNVLVCKSVLKGRL